MRPTSPQGLLEPGEHRQSRATHQPHGCQQTLGRNGAAGAGDGIIGHGHGWHGWLSGLRPGEKLYEELLLGHNPSPTLHPRIMKAQEEFLHWAQLETRLAELDLALQHNDVLTIRLQMQHLVPGYTPSEAIVDWVYLEQAAEARLRG